MCPETGLGQARRLASVVVEKCRGALSVKQDNQTRPPWRRTVSLLASVVLMLASAWSALIWVNAVGSLSSWVGLPIDPEVVKRVEFRASVCEKVSLILLPIAAWLMRLPESLASLSIQQPFLSNLFDFVWDVRNNYFMRLGLTVVFTFILLVVTVLAAPLFFYFLSLAR